MENQQLLALIRQKDEATIQQIYLAVADSCRQYICNRGGNEADALDVLQDAMYRFYQKVQKDPDLELPGRVDAYVFGIIKNVWRERQKKIGKSNTYYDLDREDSKIGDRLADEAAEIALEEPEEGLVIRLLDQLGKDCKEVLLAFYVHKMRLNEIAEEHGFSNGYVKQKRYRCTKQLRKLYNLNRD